MDCQKPNRNPYTNQWEVWDFAYEEAGERHYEVHTFWTFKEAMEFWKIRNPKTDGETDLQRD